MASRIDRFARGIRRGTSCALGVGRGSACRDSADLLDLRWQNHVEITTLGRSQVSTPSGGSVLRRLCAGFLGHRCRFEGSALV
jgi:hypothetical protein